MDVNASFRRRAVYTFKVILLGEPNVGKTSLFQRLRIDSFSEWGPTLSVDEFLKEYVFGGKKVRLRVCDTGGNERFRTLTGNYYHSAAASVCVYDVAAEETFLRLVSWMADTRKFQPNQTLFLVANKCDSSIEIDKEREQVFIEEHEINQSFNTSAKSGEGVEACFENVARILLRAAEKTQPEHFEKSFKLSHDQPTSKDQSCCG